AIFKARGWRSGILVTSAAHMPRALAAFQRVGLNVVPATTSVSEGPIQFDGRLDLKMDNEALRRTTEAVKEIVGLLIYRFLGWAYCRAGDPTSTKLGRTQSSPSRKHTYLDELVACE